MSAHTRGPWSIDWNISRLDVHSDGKLVATMRRSTNDGPPTYDDAEAKSNARLIAAAPDLLEALQALLLRVTKGYDGLPQGYGIKLAEAAIAKATGQKGGAS